MYAVKAELDNIFCQLLCAAIFSRSDQCVRTQRAQDEVSPEDELNDAEYDSG